MKDKFEDMTFFELRKAFWKASGEAAITLGEFFEAVVMEFPHLMIETMVVKNKGSDWHDWYRVELNVPGSKNSQGFGGTSNDLIAALMKAYLRLKAS